MESKKCSCLLILYCLAYIFKIIMGCEPEDYCLLQSQSRLVAYISIHLYNKKHNLLCLDLYKYSVILVVYQ